jgi:hypothetical protein
MPILQTPNNREDTRRARMTSRRGVLPYTSLLVIGMISNGCYPAPPRQLPGRYEAHADWGNSALELHGRGTLRLNTASCWRSAAFSNATYS